MIASSDGSVTLSVTAPPRTPHTEGDFDLEERLAALEALIEEARRRARRRRRLYAVAVLAAIGSGIAAYFGIGGGAEVSPARPAAGGPPRPAAFRSGDARWGPSHGPEGGWISSLAIDPSNPEIVYAGGWGNVFKSTNGGDRWTDVTTQPWTRVTALAVDPTRPRIVYAGTDRGIAKTVDRGHRWRMVNAGLFDRETTYQRGHRLGEGFVGKLVVDAHRPNTVYAVTDRGLFRTNNGGTRWRVIGPRLSYYPNCDNCRFGPYGYPVAVAIDPERARTVYAMWAHGGPGGRPALNLYKSSDGGNSWHRIGVRDGSPSFMVLALDPHSPGTIYGIPDDWNRLGLFKSTDEGATWRVVGLRRQHLASLWVDPRRPGTVIATTGTGAFKSSDGGTTWRGFGKGAVLRYGTVVAGPGASGTVYGAGEDGVSKSSDGGRTWRPIDTGLVSTFVGALVSAHGTLYAGTGQGVFTSSDGGRAWRLQESGLGGKSVIALAVSPQDSPAIYAGTTGLGVFKSVDRGLNWKPVNTGLTGKTVRTLAIDPRSPTTVYAVAMKNMAYATGNGGTVVKTVDGGATWRAITGPRDVQSIAIDPRAHDTVFAGTTGSLFRSRDGGDSWRLVATAPSPSKAAAKSHVANPDTFDVILIDPHDSQIVYAGIRTGGVLKSADGGDTWLASSVGLANKDIRTLAVDLRDSQIVYVSTGGGVFRTTDGARSWHRFGRGLAAIGVGAFAIDPAGRAIYAGTDGNGVVDFKFSR
jgi:photosystem II stability/assembly factor-like uncharacterized protein